jgi:hypothetical protein
LVCNPSCRATNQNPQAAQCSRKKQNCRQSTPVGKRAKDKGHSGWLSEPPFEGGAELIV